ncbi:MAG: hypothetical protein LBQ42_10185 [Synergistaceae bacterium]|jgi:hypothetical protein|nr:hypothetical protein [Synergistaceae bacterium]
MMEHKTFEDELDAIRLAIYEEIKDMTPEEEIAYLKSRSDTVLREYGLRTVNQIKAEKQAEKEAVLS